METDLLNTDKVLPSSDAGGDGGGELGSIEVLETKQREQGKCSVRYIE